MSKLEELISELCPDGVEYKKLEECCTVLDRQRKPVTKAAREAGEYPYYGANGIQDYVSDYIFDGTFVLVGEDGSVITPEGTPVVNWAEGKIWVNNHAHIIEERMILYTAADADAPFGVSAKSQFFLPTVKGRMAFSAALFEIAHLPSSR